MSSASKRGMEHNEVFDLRTELWIALNGCTNGDEEKGFYCGETHLCASCLKDMQKLMGQFDEVPSRYLYKEVPSE